MGPEPTPAVTPDRRWRRAPTVARAGFSLAVVALLVRVVAGRASELRAVEVHPRPAWLLAAAPFTLAGGLLLPLAWRRLLAAYGASLAAPVAVRVWCLSQAGRWVPTGVVALASRVVLSARAGVARSLAGASLLVEVGIMVAWGALATGALLPPDALAGPVRAVLVVGAAAALVALPVLLRQAGRLVPRLGALAPAAQRRRPLVEAVALYGANAAAKSFGFVLFAAAFLPVRAADAGLLVGAVNGAAIAGMVGVTPAGIGVRESVLAALVGARFGLGPAAAMAVALRGWDLAFELVWLGVAGALRGSARAPAGAA